MSVFWRISRKFMILDLPEYLSHKTFTGSRTAAFTCSGDKRILVKSCSVYFPIFLEREIIVPHPFLSRSVVKFYLVQAAHGSTDRILQVFVGLVA